MLSPFTLQYRLFTPTVKSHLETLITLYTDMAQRTLENAAKPERAESATGARPGGRSRRQLPAPDGKQGRQPTGRGRRRATGAGRRRAANLAARPRRCPEPQHFQHRADGVHPHAGGTPLGQRRGRGIGAPGVGADGARHRKHVPVSRRQPDAPLIRSAYQLAPSGTSVNLATLTTQSSEMRRCLSTRPATRRNHPDISGGSYGK